MLRFLNFIKSQVTGSKPYNGKFLEAIKFDEMVKISYVNYLAISYFGKYYHTRMHLVCDSFTLATSKCFIGATCQRSIHQA